MFSAVQARRAMSLALLVAVVLLTSGCKQELEVAYLEEPAFDSTTLERLRMAYPVNMDEIIQAKALPADAEASMGFLTTTPYKPALTLEQLACEQSASCAYAATVLGSARQQFPGRESVYNWWEGRDTAPEAAEVCAVTFTDASRTAYELRTFANLAELALHPEYTLTHFHACGTCSTLQDLAVYGELDLTIMAKTCAKRSSLASKKTCMQEIGLTEPCAETWAYNASQTGKSCALECIKTYGLLALLTGKESAPNTDEDGNLNACLLCDEMMAGPGFQYGAGRIRRNSGIQSEIDRPSDQVYSVAHDYF